VTAEAMGALPAIRLGPWYPAPALSSAVSAALRPAVITGIFLPLAVRRNLRLSR